MLPFISLIKEVIFLGISNKNSNNSPILPIPFIIVSAIPPKEPLSIFTNTINNKAVAFFDASFTDVTILSFTNFFAKSPTTCSRPCSSLPAHVFANFSAAFLADVLVAC